MTLYQVSFYRICPGCTTTEDDALTAFVMAESFDHAAEKVGEKYKTEYESARIFGIGVATKCEIID